MSKPVIAVTGKNGQLGYEIKAISAQFSDFDFVFTGRDELDLYTPETIDDFFDKHKPDFFINCAAYTAVDKAETDIETAMAVNATSVGLIAKHCNEINCPLITISTDYVFDGQGTKPYTIDYITNPINHYGYTKLLGEEIALQNNPQTIVIRTSWIYSEHGNNFVKTMLRLMAEKHALSIVGDQIGSPTYAKNLATAILTIIQQINDKKVEPEYGIFHYSDKGIISWFQFAKEIKAYKKIAVKVSSITTENYPTPAKRPAYSVLDSSRMKAVYGIESLDWKESLHSCLDKL